MMESIIVDYILSYIKKPRQIKKLRLVNRQFNLQGSIGWWHNVDFSQRSQCEIKSADLVRIPSAHADKIYTLSLKGRRDIKCEDFVLFLIRCLRLRNLDLEGCPWVDGRVIEALPNRVCSLTIDAISGMSDRLFRVVKDLKNPHFNKLQEIKLDGTSLREEDFEVIAECTSVTKCCVSSCQMLTDNSLRCIKNLKRLTCLKLREGNKFTKDGLVSLFSPDFVVPLVDLDFSDCRNFDDDCVFRMTQCCSNTLKNLDLSKCNGITDSGINFIIENCSVLKELRLCMLPEITWIHFMEVPQKTPGLQNLNLEMCARIDQEEIMNMVQRKRDLEIVDFFGELVKVEN